MSHQNDRNKALNPEKNLPSAWHARLALGVHSAAAGASRPGQAASMIYRKNAIDLWT